MLPRSTLTGDARVLRDLRERQIFVIVQVEQLAPLFRERLAGEVDAAAAWVPIDARPSSGVKPMEVSIALPRPLTARDRRAVAEVAGDQAQLPRIGWPTSSAALLGYVLVAGAVEAVAADLVLLVVLIRDSVHVVRLGHRLMECGIEYSDHRNVRTHNLAAGLNTDQVGRVVERRQRYAVLDRLDGPSR